MNLSPLLIVTIVFSILYIVIVLYFFIGWLRLKRSQKPGTKSQESQLPSVSIIIPVRNESESIKQCLESIFRQNYPEDLLEVVVIDDYSTDTTLQLLREFKQPNLKVFDLMQYLKEAGEQVPNKKKAIALGIKNAKGEMIITTDGDSESDENWVRTMVDFYRTNQFKLVTAPVMVKPAWFPLQIFQQFDVMNLLGITGAAIGNNSPVLCNGTNLIYEKKTFLEVEGFKGSHDVPIGDDILLMQKINERYPNSVGFLKNFDACVFVKPEKGIGSFFSQRLRWISKSLQFTNWRINTLLYFSWLFNLLILLTGVYSLQMQEFTWLPLVVVGGTKLFTSFLFNIPVIIFFRKWFLLLLLPVTESFYVLYVIIIGLLSIVGKYRWKDRLIR